MIHSIKEWFKAAKPNPSTADACVQIDCHYEEVSEMSAVLYDDVEYALEATALKYKINHSRYLCVLEELSADARVELLDALCDQVVTAVGVDSIPLPSADITNFCHYLPPQDNLK